MALAIVLAIGSMARAEAPASLGWRDRLGQHARIAALGSTEPAARREAARWLGRHGDPDDAVTALVQQLEGDTDPDVRIAVAESLARRGDPRAITVLGSMPASMRTAEREARLRALAAIDDPEARTALAAALGGPGADIAAVLAIDIGAPMIDALVPLLAVPTVAARAASAIGAIGDARGGEALLERVGDADPVVRAAVIEALGAIADGRAAEAVRAALADPDPVVVLAALGALARVGTLSDAPAIEARLVPGVEDQEGGAPVARAAWRALLVLAPERAAARGIEPEGERAEVLLEHPHPALIEPLVAIARRDARGSDALARVDDDAAARALVGLVREGAPGASLALALALARGRRADGAIEILRSEPSAARQAALLAIALRSDAGPVREDAIAGTDDPLALEVLARAHAEAGGSIDATAVLALRDPRARIARAILASIARPSGSAEVDRELVRSLHALARDRMPRARAVALESLARRGEGATTLAAALEDPIPEVRLAAARALAPRRERPLARLASRLAVEADPRVRRALRDAIAGRAAPHGEQCLIVQLERYGAPGPVVVEVVLDDGRWLLEQTLPSGELVLCGLADGVADVRLPP